jgi:hypothetical protein
MAPETKPEACFVPTIIDRKGRSTTLKRNDRITFYKKDGVMFFNLNRPWNTPSTLSFLWGRGLFDKKNEWEASFLVNEVQCLDFARIIGAFLGLQCEKDRELSDSRCFVIKFR